jgi:hypothetical protein
MTHRRLQQKKFKTSGNGAQLRRHAQARLRKLSQTRRSGDGDPKSAADARRLVHELHVHEIELEVQNENLSRARAQAEASADKFSELYDLAPIGYLTLDRKGTMRQMNLSGARLLGGERARLLNRRLGLFVAQGDRLAFSAFLEKVFAGRTRKRCEVTLARGGSQPLTVQIECMRSAGGQECRAVVLDITERQQAREALQRAHDELELCVAARTEDLRRANAELRAEIA